MKNIKFSKNKIVLILILFFLLFLFFLFLNRGMSLKGDIKKYKGDGSTTYLQGSLLGIPGLSIKMPQFDFSRPFEAEYNLNNIPKGNYYIIYLVVPRKSLPNEVLEGSFDLQIYKNSFLIKEIFVASLKDMTETTSNGESKFYFDKLDEQGVFNIKDDNSVWSIKITTKNEKLLFSVNAYIEISRGGYK
jgi:hypothetical protein